MEFENSFMEVRMKFFLILFSVKSFHDCLFFYETSRAETASLDREREKFWWVFWVFDTWKHSEKGIANYFSKFVFSFENMRKALSKTLLHKKWCSKMKCLLFLNMFVRKSTYLLCIIVCSIYIRVSSSMKFLV